MKRKILVLLFSIVNLLCTAQTDNVDLKIEIHDTEIRQDLTLYGILTITNIGVKKIKLPKCFDLYFNLYDSVMNQIEYKSRFIYEYYYLFYTKKRIKLKPNEKENLKFFDTRIFMDNISTQGIFFIEYWLDIHEPQENEKTSNRIRIPVSNIDNYNLLNNRNK
ncbi:MAG: hypothetical protein K8R53_02050 [Bacteroidales bacterium]|nr:hypothetical protein [Bacteroidales bacterium]